MGTLNHQYVPICTKAPTSSISTIPSILYQIYGTGGHSSAFPFQFPTLRTNNMADVRNLEAEITLATHIFGTGGHISALPFSIPYIKH